MVMLIWNTFLNNRDFYASEELLEEIAHFFNT